jgi:hypothetical protein
MKHNVGHIDRALRMTVGLILLALTGSGLIGWWGLIGLVPLITGMVSVCPLYTVLGLDTCSPKAP